MADWDFLTETIDQYGEDDEQRLNEGMSFPTIQWVNGDAKLKPIFGKDQVTMFELTKLVSQQLS